MGWLIQGTVVGLLVFVAVTLFGTITRERKQKKEESFQEMAFLCRGHASCLQKVEPAFDACYGDHHRWRTVGRRKKQFELDTPGLRDCMAQQGVDFP